MATLDAAALHAAAEARDLTVFEPYESQPMHFRAWPLADLLDAAYGESWREEEELLFTCLDGYEPSVPVARLLEHEAFLAFGRPDHAFTIQKRESGRVQTIALAPFYVIWDNLESETLRADHDYGWPYQVVGMELIRAADRFPRLAPDPDASPQVMAGFLAFRVHCSRCHALHGEGGTLGPELGPAGVRAGARDPQYLRRWIDDPARMNPTARMPALNPNLADRAETLDALVAYLHAVAVPRP